MNFGYVSILTGALALAGFFFRWWYLRRGPLRQARYQGAAERVLTLMFIDVVGFSRTAEMQPPQAVFAELQELMRWITEVVYSFNGRVDRTLGDGLFCVFGMDDSSPTDLARQVDRAVACAIQIQRRHLAHALKAVSEGSRRVSPLRIGINTSSVYVGDLGGRRRNDFTVIGNGVNLAERLEAACEGYRILIGPTTHSLLSGRMDAAVALRKRLIPLKHQREPLEVCEVDPFHTQVGDVSRVLAAYWEAIGTERMEERWQVPQGTTLRVETQYGPGELVNFSLNGLGLRLQQYLGPQLPLSITLGSEAPHLKSILEKAGVEEVVGEVRWARPLDKGFVHGILIRNLSAAQREALLARLMQWAHIEDKAA